MKQILGNYIKQIRGVSYKPIDLRASQDLDAIPILRANNITDDGIDYSDLIFVNSKCVTEDQLLKAGDILICTSSGSKNLVGKAAQITKNIRCSFGAFCKVIRGQNVNENFLGYFFQSPYYRKSISNASAGVNINNIRVEDINNIEIDFPVGRLQQEIADKFNKIYFLISKRKEQLKKIDLLIKSKFIEMFGDIKQNNLGWEKQKGKDLFKFSSGKFLIDSKRMGIGIPVYGGNGIAWYTDEAMINFSTLIIGRVGVYCGNVRLVNGPVWITDNAIYIKDFLTNKFNLQFLHQLMININFSQFADFSGQPKITQKPLDNSEYIIPPIDLQNEFAHFVEKIEKLKATIKRSLVKLEILKKSLMQKYFG